MQILQKSIKESGGTIMSKRLFIDEIAPAAQMIEKKYQILPSLIIAQACLESGFGKSALATTGKNLFGIKGTYQGDFVLMPTKEWNKQKGWHTIEAKFRRYPSWKESIEDHAQLFVRGLSREKTNRYQAVLGEINYKKATLAVKAAGYATDPHYPDLLNTIIEQYGLTKYDRTGTSSSFHTVKAGETLSAIAARYSISVAAIIRKNQLSNPDVIHPGQVLMIPVSKTEVQYYVVERGDSLSKIARRFRTTATKLAISNHIKDPNKIYPGQRIQIK